MLNYDESGSRGGPTLLLVHPMGADLSFWNACRAIWQADHHCLAVDLRNAGGSPRSAVPLSIEDHAADLDAVRRSLGIDRVVPIGCAVGAMAAAAYAGIHALHCDAVVLANPGFRTRPEARAMLSKRADDVRAGGMAAVLPGAIDGAFLGCPTDARRDEFLQHFARQDPSAYALQIEGMLDADTSKHLEMVACPALLVAGGNDRLLPPDHARQCEAMLSGSEFVLIEDGAHFIPYQRPETFAALVGGFLKRSM